MPYAIYVKALQAFLKSPRRRDSETPRKLKLKMENKKSQNRITVILRF